MQCRASNPLARRIKGWSPKTCLGRPARKTRRTEVMKNIALRGDTKHLQPNMLGKVVLRYLDGMDEPLINRVQVILRATMGGRSVSSEEDIVTLQLLCQEVGCPYHEELRSTASSVALVVLWMGLHQEKFPWLATTLQAAAGFFFLARCCLGQSPGRSALQSA